MTDIDRLKALRRGISPKDAMRARKSMTRNRAEYWLNNALVFEWHGEPPWYAVASFRYAVRLSQEYS
jgi:hypothetical protein